MEPESDIRPSPLAGQWYPADPQRLAGAVDEYLDAARLPDLPGQVVAVVAPHAGHLYSGPVAGYAFAAVRGQAPDLVAVVSPMHYDLPHRLLTTAHTAYETPLGPVPVAAQAVQALDAELRSRIGFGLTAVRRDPEHSLEIELPFLQRALAAPFELLPVMLRDQSPRIARALGLALAAVLSGRRALLVASTDLSHFYSQPVANRLDSTVLDQVAAFDPEGVFRVEAQGKGYACGHAALAAVLWAARALGADRAQVLHYATSGDVTGDFERVVGYGAAALIRPAGSANVNELS